MADNNMSVSTAIAGKKAAYKGRKLRIAIIGCGGICQSHMAAFKNIDNAEVVAGCDILQERLDLMNEKWGLPKEALFRDGTQKPWLAMFKAMKGNQSGQTFLRKQKANKFANRNRGLCIK